MIQLRVVIALVIAAALALPGMAQDTPTTLAGNWTGSVKADIGEMPISVVIKVDGEKVTGEIKNFHGAFRIEKGERQKDGRWKLTFATEDGATGSLLGVVKGEAFAGEWDFRPNAVGTFALTRAK